MLNKIISYILLVGSVVFAFLIIYGGNSTVSVTVHSLPKPESGQAMTDAVDSVSAATDFTVDQKNSTEELVQKISDKIADLNPDGPLVKDDNQWINVEKPEVLVNKVLSDELASFNPALLRGKVADGEIKISSDTRPKDYATAFSQAVADNIGPVNNGQDISSDEIPNIIASYAALINQLLALPVPSNLASLHKRGVELFITQKNIFAKIAAMDNDPAAAVLSINLMPAVEKEIKDFNNQLVKLAS